MKLDSVRELKTAVRKRVLARVSTPLVLTRRLDLAAQPVEAMARTQPTIAIGIAPHTGKDYLRRVPADEAVHVGIPAHDMARVPPQPERLAEQLG